MNAISVILFIFSCVYLPTSTLGQGACDQEISYIAQYVRVNYNVIDNPSGTNPVWFNVSIQLHNDGNTPIVAGTWSIYFPHIRLIEPSLIIQPGGVVLTDVGMKIRHINGDLYELSPLSTFRGIAPGKYTDVRFQASDWMVARTDVMPNWYVASDDRNKSPQIILSTAGESLDFVSDFDTKAKWKRLPTDAYDPYTPEVRLDLDAVPEVEESDRHVIPTPLEMNIDWTRRVNVLSHGWVIIGNNFLEKEISYLSDKTGLSVVNLVNIPCNHYIQLENTTSTSPLSANESYEIDISYDQQTILIRGVTPAGVFYGIQTLLSLMETQEWPGEVGEGMVRDRPRFGYRGMHVDVGRNFHTVSDLEKIMEGMAQYKLNKLHLHLTDDEGWRLEIPEIPELTEVGAKRCHDLSELECIIPLLGSGPTLSSSGTGFYTVAQYQGLLRFASARHIQVIPEFGVVAHAHAAVKSMEARYHRYKESNITKAEEFLLRDHNDTTRYFSIQYYTDNAINPCITSTYHFIKVLLQSVQEMHRDIQPLEIVHFGGDEAPPNSYINSTSCAPYIANGTILKQLFVKRASDVATDLGLDIAMWEDGIHFQNTPLNRSHFRPQNIYSTIWNNVWEWGSGGHAYDFANNGYKVILAHSTHLYFDFPYEPDPEERGYYWATRIVPIKKAFSYVPDSVYMNIDLDVGRMGNPISSAEICQTSPCPELLEQNRPNVVGIQGQLWSETVRTSDQLHYMIFPRLLALAERAWHKAAWEHETDVEILKRDLEQDWIQFANTLGHKELRRLDNLGVRYRVPIAGARVNNATGFLEWTAGFPGLPARYSTSPDATEWTDLSQSTSVSGGTPNLHVKIGSADSSRYSRIVNPVPGSIVSGSSRISHALSLIICTLAFLLL